MNGFRGRPPPVTPRHGVPLGSRPRSTLERPGSAQTVLDLSGSASPDPRRPCRRRRGAGLPTSGYRHRGATPAPARAGPADAGPRRGTPRHQPGAAAPRPGHHGDLRQGRPRLAADGGQSLATGRVSSPERTTMMTRADSRPGRLSRPAQQARRRWCRLGPFSALLTDPWVMTGRGGRVCGLRG